MSLRNKYAREMIRIVITSTLKMDFFKNLQGQIAQVVGDRSLYLSTNCSYWMNCVDSYSCSSSNVFWVMGVWAPKNITQCLENVNVVKKKNLHNSPTYGNCDHSKIIIFNPRIYL